MGTLHRCIGVPIALLLVAACAKSDRDATSDSATGNVAVSDAGATAAEPIELSKIAGKWEVRAKPVDGSDTTTTTYVLNATSDTTGWTITFPGRKPEPVHVVVQGDSIVTHVGPFNSVRRKGVNVRTESAFRLDGDRIVGTTVARYSTSGADSVLRLRNEATRMP